MFAPSVVLVMCGLDDDLKRGFRVEALVVKSLWVSMVDEISDLYAGSARSGVRHPVGKLLNEWYSVDVKSFKR
jgi:hypothetical protein